MKRLLVTAVLALCASGAATAAPVLGQVYLDAANQKWTYIGSFRVSDGPDWSDGGITYNGIEAATLLFGAPAPGGAYALSTDDDFVNHLAWYDGYGQTQHLDNGGGNVGLPEDINEDPDGDGYTFAGFGLGDWSAYIRDHDEALNSVNYVFTRLDDVPGRVPEPSSIALTLLGAAALGAARRRKA